MDWQALRSLFLGFLSGKAPASGDSWLSVEPSGTARSETGFLSDNFKEMFRTNGRNFNSANCISSRSHDRWFVQHHQYFDQSPRAPRAVAVGLGFPLRHHKPFLFAVIIPSLRFRDVEGPLIAARGSPDQSTQVPRYLKQWEVLFQPVCREVPARHWREAQ